MFLQLDGDKDGEVDILELASGLKALHVTLTQAQLLAFRNDVDTDGNGGISLDEFLMAVKVHSKLQAASDARDPAYAQTEAVWAAVLAGAGSNPARWTEQVEAMFAAFDADGSGAIDTSELASGLASLGVRLDSTQVAAFRADVDTDCDGQISLAEFLMAVRQRARLQDPTANGKGSNSSGGVPMADTFDHLELDAYNKASNEAFAKIIAVASSDPKGWKKSIEKLFASFDRDGSHQVTSPGRPRHSPLKSYGGVHAEVRQQRRALSGSRDNVTKDS